MIAHPVSSGMSPTNQISNPVEDALSCGDGMRYPAGFLTEQSSLYGDNVIIKWVIFVIGLYCLWILLSFEFSNILIKQHPKLSDMPSPLISENWLLP
jgi:hypothetical protein